MPAPKRILRGLPALGRVLDARQSARSVQLSQPPPGLPGGPRLPLGLPHGIGAAMPSTLRGGATPGGGGLPGGGDPGDPADPYNPAYPEGPPASAAARLLFQSVADPRSVSNSTSETALSDIAGGGSLALPAGWWSAGRVVGLELSGGYSADLFLSLGYSITLRIKLGGATCLSVVLPAGPFTYAGQWRATLRLACWEPEGSPQFHGHGSLLAQASQLADPPLPNTLHFWSFSDPPVDCADALAVSLSAQADEALPGNSITLSDLALWRLG